MFRCMWAYESIDGYKINIELDTSAALSVMSEEMYFFNKLWENNINISEYTGTGTKHI